MVAAAGFEAGAGEAFAAKGLDADDGADQVAVEVSIADADALLDLFDDTVDQGSLTCGLSPQYN
jgi:hypothetical protein